MDMTWPVKRARSSWLTHLTAPDSRAQADPRLGGQRHRDDTPYGYSVPMKDPAFLRHKLVEDPLNNPLLDSSRQCIMQTSYNFGTHVYCSLVGKLIPLHDDAGTMG